MGEHSRQHGEPNRPLVRELVPRVGEPINADLINAFVGPANSGKTEALHDIIRLAANFEPLGKEHPEQPTRVIRDLTLNKLTLDRLALGLTQFPSGQEGGTILQGFGPDLRTAFRHEVGPEVKSILTRPLLTAKAVKSTALGAIMPLRALLLDSRSRTQSVAATSSGRPDRVPENLLQALHDAPSAIHERLDAGFEYVFPGQHLQLDDAARIELTLRVGKSRVERRSDPHAYLRAFETLQRLDGTGDNWRAVAAVLLGVVLGQGRIVLIDQPELYLHPSVARRLGRWLADHHWELDCQLFLATNSDQFLRGLLEGEAPTSVIRCCQEAATTRCQSIPSAVCRRLAQDHRLAGQEGLKSLFTDKLVLLTRPAEAILYERIASEIEMTGTVEFYHCFSPRHLGDVARLLRESGAQLSTVAGMEILQHDYQFCDIVEATCGQPAPSPWRATRDRLEKQIEQSFDQTALSSDRKHVEKFLDAYEAAAPEPPAVPEPNSKSADAWRQLDLDSVHRLPLELKTWVEDLVEELKQHGLFIAPKPCWDFMRDLLPDGSESTLPNAVQEMDQGNGPPELQAFVAELMRR